MRGLRKLMLGSAATALAVTALGAPAAAADDTGTLAIVNGVPGTKIDICIGNKEQKSGAGYGSVYQKDVIGTGSKLIRVFKKNDSRSCGGTRLASKTLNIAAGDDLTIVVTKRAPKILVFDNVSPSFLGEIPPRGDPMLASPYAARNASELELNVWFQQWLPNAPYTWDVQPAAAAVYGKGDQYRSSGGDYAGQYWRMWATKPEASAAFAKRTTQIKASRRYEFVFVGTTKANARLVLVNRGVSDPSP